MRSIWSPVKIVLSASIAWSSACDAEPQEMGGEPECVTSTCPEPLEVVERAALTATRQIEPDEARAASRSGEEERCETAYVIENSAYPTFTGAGAGCSADNGVTLKASAEQIGPGTMRFHVMKGDELPFSQEAMLTLYVGERQDCDPTPVNVVKATNWVDTGKATQMIDLSLDTYASWATGESKKFWIGKSESGLPSARATGVITIRRTCL